MFVAQSASVALATAFVTGITYYLPTVYTDTQPPYRTMKVPEGQHSASQQRRPPCDSVWLLYTVFLVLERGAKGVAGIPTGSMSRHLAIAEQSGVSGGDVVDFYLYSFLWTGMALP